MVTVTPWPSGTRYQGLASKSRVYGHEQMGIWPNQKHGEDKILLPWEIPTSGKLDPLVCMFYGRRGQGKTLSMTCVAKIMRDKFIADGIKSSPLNPRGAKIASNYHVKFADFTNAYLVDMLVEFPPWAENMICMVDEILAYFPSRRSLARGNLNFVTFIQQIRKRNIELLFTTQYPQRLDVQMIEQIDLFIRPSLYQRSNTIWLEIFDWWGHFTGDWRRKTFPPTADEPPNWRIPIYNYKAMFGQYPTNEVVAPTWAGNRDEIVSHSWSDDELQNPDGTSIFDDETIGEIHAPPPPSKAKTVSDLIQAQGDSFYIDLILNEAKVIDPAIKKSTDMREHLEDEGFVLMKDAHRWLAVREDKL